MVILGIDPGLASTGFGTILCEARTASLHKCGSIRTSPRDHVSRRLFQIHEDLNHLLSTLKPQVVAVENIFSMVRYPKAGITLGGVMAIIYLSAFRHEVTVIEVTPREVKNALVSYGGATKVQIKEAVKRALSVNDLKSFHVADALAVALTVFYRGVGGKSDIIPGRNVKKDICR